jgi:hypothetical protein
METEADTLLSRILAAGISEERAMQSVTSGLVRLDGTVETDPAAPAPWPTRIVFIASN